MPKGSAHHIATVGWSVMAAVFISAVTIHFAGWIQNHAASLTKIMWVSGVLTAVCVTVAHFTNESDPGALQEDRPSLSQIGKNNQVAGRDALSFFGNDAIETALKSQANTAPAAAAPRVPRDSDPNPLLEISVHTGSEFVSWNDDHASWKIDRHGKRMLLVTVSNPLAEDGGTVKKAEKISVSASFSYENHFLLDIERAYWLGESSNQVEILGGTKKQIVLGFPMDGEWHCYENEHAYPFSRSWGGGFREWREAIEKSLPHGEKLNFKVSVLRTKRNGDVATLASRAFRLKIVTDTGVWYCEAVKK